MRTVCIFLLLVFNLPGLSDAQPNQDSSTVVVKNEIIVALKNTDSSKNYETKADLYRQLAAIYELETRPDSAINFYHKSSVLYKSLGQEVEYYAMLDKLGVLYSRLYNYKLAITNLKQVTDYYLSKKMYRPYALAMNQLGMAYSGNNQDEEARKCFIATLEVNNSILKDTTIEIENKTNLIKNDIKSKNYERALKFAKSNDRLFSRNANDSLNGYNNFLIGQIYYYLNDYNKAVSYFEKSEPSLVKQSKYQELPELYKMMLLVYVEMRNKEKIASVLDKYINIVNEVKNTEIVKSGQEIAQRFDSENKDLVIKQLENENELKTLNGKQQRIMIYILIFAFFATILAVYLTYRNYTNRFRTNQIINQQRNELQDQQLKEIEKDGQIKAMESMLLGQEAERNRIGKDLHDSLGAMLSTIKLQMSANQGNDNNGQNPALKKTKDMIDEACEEVRKISRDMMPITLSKYGLHTALEELIEKFTFEGSPTVIYQAFGINRSSDRDLDLFVFRIVQELVNNSVKHAQAQEIIIQINYLEDIMMITVEDDGKGFVYDQSLYQGMGLKNVEYRAQYLKGKFSVESGPGHGTIMVVEIPIKSFKQKEIPVSNS